MADRTITALFRSREAAENARDQLKAAGVGHIDLHSEGGSSIEDAARTAGEKTRSLFERVAEVFGGHDDSHAYAEGVKRGNYLLTAKAEESRTDEALRLLRSTEAVDVDQEEASWRDQGWSGHYELNQLGGTAGIAEFGATPAAASVPVAGGAEARNAEQYTMPDSAPVDSVALEPVTAASSPEATPTRSSSEEADRAEAMQATYGSELGKSDAAAATPTIGSTDGSTGGMAGAGAASLGSAGQAGTGRREADRSDSRIRSYVVEGSAEEPGDYQLGGGADKFGG